MEMATTTNYRPAGAERKATMTFTIRVSLNGRNEDTKVSARAFTYEQAEAMAAERASTFGPQATWRVIAG